MFNIVNLYFNWYKSTRFCTISTHRHAYTHATRTHERISARVTHARTHSPVDAQTYEHSHTHKRTNPRVMCFVRSHVRTHQTHLTSRYCAHAFERTYVFVHVCVTSYVYVTCCTRTSSSERACHQKYERRTWSNTTRSLQCLQIAISSYVRCCLEMSD